MLIYWLIAALLIAGTLLLTGLNPLARLPSIDKLRQTLGLAAGKLRRKKSLKGRVYGILGKKKENIFTRTKVEALQTLAATGEQSKSKRMEQSCFALAGVGVLIGLLTQNLFLAPVLGIWGDNTYGQLGLGAEAPERVLEPTELTYFKELPGDMVIADIAVCEDASYVLLANGDLYSFGRGANGRLGLGNIQDKNTPQLVAKSAEMGIKRILSGAAFVVAETHGNELWAWGDNSKGQVGNGSEVASVLLPVKIMDYADVKHLAVGSDYVIMVDLNGEYWAWGSNADQRLGLTNDIQIQFAYDAWFNYSEVRNNWPAASVAKLFSKSPKYDASWKNLGVPSNGNTHLNIPTTALEIPETSYLRDGTTSTAIYYRARDAATNLVFASTNPTSYIYDDDDTWYYKYYQKGWVPTKQSILALDKASTVALRASEVSYLAAGNAHNIVKLGNEYYTWGKNDRGQMGVTPHERGIPVVATNISTLVTTLTNTGEGAKELIVSGDTNYMLTNNNSVYVWGSNTNGKAGAGSTPWLAEPVIIDALYGKDIIQIVTGRNTTYFISDSGEVYVAGSNARGQTGLGTGFTNRQTVETPTLIETFKFSETALPPEPPKKVVAPPEAPKGEEIEVEWNEVPDAVSYDLTRTVTYNGSLSTQTIGNTFMAVASANSVTEKIYTGSATSYKDTISPDWDEVEYSVKALNFVGDYSPSVSTGRIQIKAAVGGGTDTDTTPPTLTVTTNAVTREVTIIATDTESGMEGIYVNGTKVATHSYVKMLSQGESMVIYAVDNANNVSTVRTVTYNDVVGGTDTGNNNNNNGSGDNKELLALIAAIMGGGNNGDSDALLKALVGLQAASGTGSDSAAALPPELLAALAVQGGSSGGDNTLATLLLLQSMGVLGGGSAAATPIQPVDSSRNINISIPREAVDAVAGMGSGNDTILQMTLSAMMIMVALMALGMLLYFFAPILRMKRRQITARMEAAAAPVHDDSYYIPYENYEQPEPPRAKFNPDFFRAAPEPQERSTAPERVRMEEPAAADFFRTPPSADSFRAADIEPVAAPAVEDFFSVVEMELLDAPMEPTAAPTAPESYEIGQASPWRPVSAQEPQGATKEVPEGKHPASHPEADFFSAADIELQPEISGVDAFSDSGVSAEPVAAPTSPDEPEMAAAKPAASSPKPRAGKKQSPASDKGQSLLSKVNTIVSSSIEETYIERDNE